MISGDKLNSVLRKDDYIKNHRFWVTIGKTFTFDAAHHIPGHPKCGAVHGHTYTCTVELHGIVEGRDSMLYDFNFLSEVKDNFDHTNLGDNSTCEQLAMAILQLVSTKADENIAWISVKLQEGNGGWAKITEPLSTFKFKGEEE